MSRIVKLACAARVVRARSDVRHALQSLIFLGDFPPCNAHSLSLWAFSSPAASVSSPRSLPLSPPRKHKRPPPPAKFAAKSSTRRAMRRSRARPSPCGQRARTAIVAGAIAGPDGAFRIQGLRPGAYTLRMTFIGFAPLVQDVTIAPRAPVVDVGAIKLSQVAVALSAVAVTEERAAVTVEPDRNAYRAKDVAPAAANASELLDNVPSVSGRRRTAR